ncbi:MAG: hypothetical protein AAB967_02800, partial [Patescibacteria group bacterium]
VSGLKDLTRIFLYRTSIVNTAEPLSFYQSIKATAGSLYYNIGWMFTLIVPLWAVVAMKRDWWTAGLLPTFVAYSLIFRNYTGHQYTHLMFVVFSFLTFIAGFFYLAQMARGRLGNRRVFYFAVLAGGLIALSIAVVTHRKNMQYALHDAINNTRLELEKLDPSEYATCTRFTFEASPGFFPSGAAQYYFGMNVVRKLNLSLPDVACKIIINERVTAVIKN